MWIMKKLLVGQLEVPIELTFTFIPKRFLDKWKTKRKVYQWTSKVINIFNIFDILIFFLIFQNFGYIILHFVLKEFYFFKRGAFLRC